MAACSPTRVTDGVEEGQLTEAEPEDEPWAELGPVVKRDPVIQLPSPVSGFEPLTWSEDHRLSASTASGISLMEVLCDVHGNNQDLVLHRTSIPVPDKVCELKVNIGHT